ncbi:diuretic hormone class 2-like [Oppia nitens]|uniref:diuretic hormone class 2-like n=1 Tax=Oppia nitens TaxID=1686743 RepID=UPI0023DBD681|nr:diuretic hormone class 2-like [Oppia nitens]XP_054153398.1 diuretic hormone class 2-like [Oppia nitens]
MKNLSPEKCISIAIIISIIYVSLISAFPQNDKRLQRSIIEIENPEQVMNVLESLAQSIANTDYNSYKNQKRGIDLGLSRGFSGSQAAKHLMGMSAASFANGPGRRRK